MRLNKRSLIASFLAGTLLASSVAPAHAFLGKATGQATEVTQLLNHAELVAQLEQQIQMVEQGLSMLEKLNINNAAEVLVAGSGLQGVLWKAESIITKVGNIAHRIESLYPDDFSGEGAMATLLNAARRQRVVQRENLMVAAEIQAKLFEAMEKAEARDSRTMDASAAAPGVTAAVQATNQLLGGLNSDIRGLQLATITHHRTVEDRFLREDANIAMQQARHCENIARMPDSWKPSYCKGEAQ